MLDTNVVFDIIYPQRSRYKEAQSFYRGFEYYTLSIEIRVRSECNKVLNDYSMSFGYDLENYLLAKQRHRKAWDKLKPVERRRTLDKFLVDMGAKYKADKDGFIPFYRQIVERSKSSLSRMTFNDLRQFLFDLPSELMKHISKEIESRFTIISPYHDLDEEDTYKFKEKLKETLKNPYFTQNQSFDQTIFISIVHIFTFGDTDGNLFDSITFYTSDTKFLKVYSNISSNPPKLPEKRFEGLFSSALNGIEFRNPYEKQPQA